jgi:peroxiredoxin Q/BCP
MTKTLALVAAVFCLVGVAQIAAAAEPLKVGDAAPDFELKGSDGKTYKLSDFRDKQAVVIAWFPRAFTGGCTKECESLRDSGAELKKFNVAYFTASVDPAETNKKFAESLKVDYPILSDESGEIAKKYGIFNEDRKTAQRVTFYIGEDGKIAHIDNAVVTASHGADVAARLRALGVETKE